MAEESKMAMEKPHAITIEENKVVIVSSCLEYITTAAKMEGPATKGTASGKMKGSPSTESDCAKPPSFGKIIFMEIMKRTIPPEK